MSITDIPPQELRRYVQNHHEKDYLLVDVRQPQEYRKGHIPGARLLPLPDLAQNMDGLPADKALVLYCHSGGRSMAAAALLEEEGFGGPLYNLSGGMLAWDGGRIADVPRVSLFAGKTLTEMFATAVNLEKGAHIFYKSVAQQHAPEIWSPTFARLAKAEWAHARTVYGFWAPLTPGLAPFETLFNELSGDILEGGMPLTEALNKLAGTTDDACLRAIELALQIEYAALDLYRTLADQSTDNTSREAFISLAQAEKAHIQRLIQALPSCAPQSSS